MSHVELSCTRCGALHHPSMHALRCPACAAPLDVVYRSGDPEFSGAQPARRRGPPVPSPIHDQGSVIDLGEGNTPCIGLPVLAGVAGVKDLYAKLEFLNPTGSFKDRGAAVMIAAVREQGAKDIVEDSSGNAGASIAAYAARAGMRAHIFVPVAAPAAKIAQIRAYGATVHTVDGSREAVGDAAAAFCKERGFAYASHSLSPYFTEGTKLFAYEVAQQFPDNLPGHIVIPVGNGGLYLGVWKGFVELVKSGQIPSVPRLHCVQARAVMPIVAAYRCEEWRPVSGSGTVAGGISIVAPPRKEQILDALGVTGGSAVSVGDGEILRWQRLLAEKEGIYAEPTSAAAFAGLESLVHQGVVGRTEAVLVPVTGFGLKDTPPGQR